MGIIPLIQKGLEPLGIKTYHSTRLEDKEACIVYTYTARPMKYADDEIDYMQYTILLNLYCNDQIEKTKLNILSSMKAQGFKLQDIQATKFSDLGGFFNTPIIFKINI